MNNKPVPNSSTVSTNTKNNNHNNKTTKYTTVITVKYDEISTKISRVKELISNLQTELEAYVNDAEFKSSDWSGDAYNNYLYSAQVKFPEYVNYYINGLKKYSEYLENILVEYKKEDWWS